MPRIEIKAKDFVMGTAAIKLSAGDPLTVVLVRSAVQFLEFADVMWRYNSAVMLPGLTGPSADATHRYGLDAIAACLTYLRAHPSKRLVIAGHTDTVGSDASNVTLSRIRAETVLGMLKGERATFATACHGPHLTEDQRYPNGGDGSKKGVLWDDYSDVLSWIATTFGWPCAHPAGTRTLWQATKNFQDSYNDALKNGKVGSAASKAVTSNGRFTQETWQAVYDCYDLRLASILNVTNAELGTLREKVTFVNSAHRLVSCGEFKTIDKVGRNGVRSQLNRRAEVLFLDPSEQPNPPCFLGACNPETCDLYNPSLFPRKPVPVSPVGIGYRLRIRLLLESTLLIQEPFEIWFEGAKIFSGTTDGEARMDVELPGDLATVVVKLPERGLSERFQLKSTAEFPSASTLTGAQLRLQQLGYYVGDINGTSDLVTEDAIRNFKVDQGLAKDSTLDAATAAALVAAYGS